MRKRFEKENNGQTLAVHSKVAETVQLQFYLIYTDTEYLMLVPKHRIMDKTFNTAQGYFSLNYFDIHME